jgi:pimeloyl-ACP methyl ester carboxylesterase
LEAGEPNKPAVLLLHGSCSNSAFWFNDLLALSARYHVFAVDIPGEAGNSSEYRLSLDHSDYADWLAAVLDTLNLPSACIAGNSLGGWMALKFATTYPARVEKTHALCQWRARGDSRDYLERAEAAEGADEALTMEKNASGTDTLPKETPRFHQPDFGELNPFCEPRPVFSGALLARLTMPVQYVAGEPTSCWFRKVERPRWERHVPHAQVHIAAERRAHDHNPLSMDATFLTLTVSLPLD